MNRVHYHLDNELIHRVVILSRRCKILAEKIDFRFYGRNHKPQEHTVDKEDILFCVVEKLIEQRAIDYSQLKTNQQLHKVLLSIECSRSQTCRGIAEQVLLLAHFVEELMPTSQVLHEICRMRTCLMSDKCDFEDWFLSSRLSTREGLSIAVTTLEEDVTKLEKIYIFNARTPLL